MKIRLKLVDPTGVGFLAHRRAILPRVKGDEDNVQVIIEPVNTGKFAFWTNHNYKMAIARRQ